MNKSTTRRVYGPRPIADQLRIAEQHIAQLFEEIERDAKHVGELYEVLRKTVKAHEAKHGPGLPTSEAPGWQAARELLVGINKALDGDA